MKPRNKFQTEVVALSKRLPKITATQQRWAEKNCFEHYARKTKQGVISCLECWYNKKRRHSALGYLNIDEFSAKYFENKKLLWAS